MRYSALYCLGWLLVGIVSPTVQGATSAQKEFSSVLRCKPNAAHGQMLFDTCAACHGANGAGASDGTVPALAGQHFRVVAHELVSYRHEGRIDPRMQHFTDGHHFSGVQDIADLAAYVSRLPPTRSRVPDGGEESQKAAQVYAGQCASCHGGKGEGNNEKRYPRLAGQHSEYLLNQMQEASEGRRPLFPAAHVRLLRSMNRSDFADIAHYLSHVGP
jgi:cytochrome c553